ncbi:MAG: hypothetical protein ABSH48_16525 [Verrucomicrobiota bacterium]
MNKTNKTSKFPSLPIALVIAGALVTSAVSGHGQGAVATISDVPASGGYDYTITLQDTGSTVLNSFWYGWTTSGNNLPPTSNPSDLGNNLSWGQSVFGGNSIQWVNSTGTALAPGASGTFTFFSTTTPSAITTLPSGESVAYVHGIDFSQGSPGDSTSVFTPTTVPEPTTWALLACGSLGLLAFGRRTERA